MWGGGGGRRGRVCPGGAREAPLQPHTCARTSQDGEKGAGWRGNCTHKPTPILLQVSARNSGFVCGWLSANRSSPVIFKVCFRGERGGRASREDLGSEPGWLSPALPGCLRLHQHWPGWVGVGQHQLRFRENRRKRLMLPKIPVTNPLPSVTQISKLIPLSIPTRKAPPVLVCLQAHIGPTRKLPLLSTRSFLSLG